MHDFFYESNQNNVETNAVKVLFKQSKYFIEYCVRLVTLFFE